MGSIALVTGLLPINGISTAQRIAELKSHWYVHLSRAVEIIAGIFMLYGQNWARWLLVAWLVFHVYVGALHSTGHLLTHALLFLIGIYLLFRPPANAYFRK
jgi:hypothetical protein